MLSQIKKSTRQACGRVWSTLKNRIEHVNERDLKLSYYILNVTVYFVL